MPVDNSVVGVLETLLSALTPAHWLAIAVALVVLYASRRLGMWGYAVLALPGTFAHESAHFLVALLLGAAPEFPSLVPQRTTQGWRLGSVRFRAGLLRSVPIVLAPVLLLPLGLAWAVYFFAPASAWPIQLLHLWLVASLLTASLPSSADWRIAFPALGLAALAMLAWWLLRG